MTESRSTAALRSWLWTMAAWKRYFRYTVEGLEHLATHDAAIVVGYHGRPIAYDLFMLGAEVHRAQGYLPLAIVHRDFMRWPGTRWLTEGLEWTTGRGAILEQALATGRHVILAPGGTREGLRPGWVRDQVDWGAHAGYLRLAISRGLAIVPVAAAGVDDAYFGLFDTNLVQRRWPRAPGLWVGIGPLGPAPWSPPFPARIHQIVGPPITARDYAGLAPDDSAGILELHHEVQRRVQELLDRARTTLGRARADRLRAIRTDLFPLS
jgi:1-acyl-sn-glycerol-3-phosphate acyltransferase